MSLAGVNGIAPAPFLIDGTMPIPDIEGNIHYEGDPTGKDPQHNDQFGLATFNLGAVFHQMSVMASNPGPWVLPCSTGFGGCSTGMGPEVHSSGWGVTGGFRFFTPMWGPSKTGTLRQPDYVWLYGDYCDGATIICGVGGSDANLSVGDAYALGGMNRDDLDARWVATPGGGSYFADKEKILVFNASYHHILTDCTDPVYCWRMNLAYNWARATPGTITQNTDWQSGGLGVGTIQRVTFNLIWGANVVNTSKPVFWETSFEVQYNWLSQALPCNNAGVAGAVCVAPVATPAQFGVAQNPSNWVFRLTWSDSW
jgi:hypothetical protein